VKLGNGLLWVTNVALGAGIVVFAFQFLLFPAGERNPIADVEAAEEDSKKVTPAKPQDVTPVRNFVNPVEPRLKEGPSSVSELRGVELTGTHLDPDPVGIFAFVNVPSRNVNVVAWFDEAVTQDGNPVGELAGWKLKKVTGNSATFTNGQKETTITKAAGFASGPGLPGPLGSTSPGERGKIQKLAVTNDRETYGVDRATMQWAIDNQEKILQEVGLQDYASGGIQVISLSQGSIAAEAGIQQNDVIKSINGQPIANSISLAELRNNPQMKQQSSLVISIERGGASKTIVIQPTQR
jgi:hypothetical protein